VGALFFLFCCFAMKRAVVVLPVWRSDLLDVGHRGRRSRGTSKQRRVSEAQLGRESRDVSQSAEKKSDVSGAGLSVRVRQRVGATILQGADKSVSRTFCAAACFSAPPEELSKMTREEVRQKFPDLLAILDATNWEQFKPENFLENRLSYSAYKHMNVYQVLLGE
jgi:hypothetical protein